MKPVRVPVLIDRSNEPSSIVVLDCLGHGISNVAYRASIWRADNLVHDDDLHDILDIRMTSEESRAQDELNFVTDVMEMLENGYGDLDDSVFKMVRDRRIIFMVNANDLFWWATADGEYITLENLPMLRQAIHDVRDAQRVSKEPPIQDRDAWKKWWDTGALGATLFCARVRGMRPQRPCYKSFPVEVKPLFDACGPERDPKEEG